MPGCGAIRLKLLGTAPKSVGDRNRLAQAISNLLNNAAKYTERGGRITPTAEQQGPFQWTGTDQGNEAVIAIRDTGIGIPVEMFARIFKPFTRVDRPLDRSSGGLGIGLALVKQPVEMHGGSISSIAKAPTKAANSLSVSRSPAKDSQASPGVRHRIPHYESCGRARFLTPLIL